MRYLLHKCPIHDWRAAKACGDRFGKVGVFKAFSHNVSLTSENRTPDCSTTLGTSDTSGRPSGNPGTASGARGASLLLKKLSWTASVTSLTFSVTFFSRLGTVPPPSSPFLNQYFVLPLEGVKSLQLGNNEDWICEKVKTIIYTFPDWTFFKTMDKIKRR